MTVESYSQISTSQLQEFWTDFFTNHIHIDEELKQYNIEFNNSIPSMYKVFIECSDSDHNRVLQKINAKTWYKLDETFDNSYDKQIVFFESEMNTVNGIKKLVLTINI